MAAISANAFSFPSFSGASLTPELFEFLRDHQNASGSKNANGNAGAAGNNNLSPLFLNNEIARLFMQQKLAQLAATGSRLIANQNSTSLTNDSSSSSENNVSKRSFVNSPMTDSTGSPDADLEEKPRKRSRVGGQSVKTAEVWRFFSQIPNEQAATCGICHKTIKATNSSTTGMIRHLRSCHAAEHEVLQHARRQNFLRKGLKSGVIDGEQLSEIAMLQQIEPSQDKESSVVNSSTDSEPDLSFVKVDSAAASTSSNASDDNQKNMHSIERLIGTPKRQAMSPKQVLKKSFTNENDVFESLPPTPKAKRGRPPKITVDDPIVPESTYATNKLYTELNVLFTFKVLPVDILDDVLFRRFLQQISPGCPLVSADEFRTKIIPCLSNASSNPQAFMKNNNFLKTPCAPRPAKSSSRTTSDAKGASPAPTNESGFHDEDEHPATDQSSVAESFFSDILNLYTSTPSEPLVPKSPSLAPAETDSVLSVSSNDVFDGLFAELLDYVGHGIFPKESLQNLVLRVHTVYETVNASSCLTKELLKLMNEPIDSLLEDVIARKVAVETGDMDDDKTLPRLWKSICFAKVAFSELNTLVKDGMVSLSSELDAEDNQLLMALFYHIANPES